MKRLRSLVKSAVILAFIAGIAMLIPAVILPVAGEAQSVAVIFGSGPAPAGLPENVTVLDWQEHVARLDGVDAITARRLYASGAVLVMPIRRSGCMSYRKA